MSLLGRVGFDQFVHGPWGFYRRLLEFDAAKIAPDQDAANLRSESDVRQLLSAYLMLLDVKDIDGALSCFTPNASVATNHGEGGAGDEQVRAFHAKFADTNLVRRHHAQNVVVRAAGDEAWLAAYVIAPFVAADRGRAGYGSIFARAAKQASGGWRFSDLYMSDEHTRSYIGKPAR